MYFESNEALSAYLQNQPESTRLSIENSPALTQVPELPDTIEYLFINNCPKLARVTNLPQALLSIIVVACKNLTEIPERHDNVLIWSINRELPEVNKVLKAGNRPLVPDVSI